MNSIKINHKPYNFLKQNGHKRFNYLYGGAASSKSWAIADYLLIEKFYNEKGIGILVIRKTKPEVKASCLRLIRQRLEKIGIPFDENKTDLIITAPNGNKFYFDSVDDILKKKSLEGVNYIWVEETTEFTHKEFLQLNIRNRAYNPNGINRNFYSFNPEDPIGNAWLKDLVDTASTREDSHVLKLNHDDNPFLSEDEHQQIEALADQDEEYNKIYRLGEWATPTYIIYTNWDVVPQMPERYDERVWGLDFGYSSNESALMELRFVGKDEVWEREHIYQTGLTNQDLAVLMKEIISNEDDIIIADSAEPKSIEEIRRAGFNNIRGCIKKGDAKEDYVRFSINTVKKYRTHILGGSENLQKEKRSYKWKQDAQGNPMAEPLKFRDHLMSAERYAIGWLNRVVEAGMAFAEPEKILSASRQNDDSDITDDDLWNDDLWD